MKILRSAYDRIKQQYSVLTMVTLTFWLAVFFSFMTIDTSRGISPALRGYVELDGLDRWVFALKSSVYVAIVIALVRDAFAMAFKIRGELSSNLRWSFRSAAVWRICLAMIIIAGIFANKPTIWHKSPIPEELFLGAVFYSLLTFAAKNEQTSSTPRFWRTTVDLLVTAGLLIVLWLYSIQGEVAITLLIHLAIHGVQLAWLGQFDPEMAYDLIHRTGNLQQVCTRYLWAIPAAIFSGYALLRFRSKFLLTLSLIVWIVSVASLSWFAWWFYTDGLKAFDPFMAEKPFGGFSDTGWPIILLTIPLITLVVAARLMVNTKHAVNWNPRETLGRPLYTQSLYILIPLIACLNLQVILAVWPSDFFDWFDRRKMTMSVGAVLFGYRTDMIEAATLLLAMSHIYGYLNKNAESQQYAMPQFQPFRFVATCVVLNVTFVLTTILAIWSLIAFSSEA